MVITRSRGSRSTAVKAPNCVMEAASKPVSHGELSEALAAEGVKKIIIAPIGFISDHMEVAFDLDIEAMATAAEHGIAAVRAATVGVHPEFVSGIVDMVIERASRERGIAIEAPTTGEFEAFPYIAPPGSCRMRHGEVTGIPVLAGERD